MINFAKIVNYKSDKTTNQEVFKETILINLIITVAIFLFIYTINNIIIEHIYGVWLTGLACLAEISVIGLFIKKKIPYTFTVNAGIFLGSICLVSDIYFTNGILSATIPWVITPPIISFLLLEKSTSTRFWIFTSILIILVFGIVNHFEIQLVNKLDHDYFAFYHLTSYIGLVFMLVIIATIFEKKKNKIYNELEQKQYELQQSENRFRTMFEKAPLGIGLTNSTSGEVTNMNNQFSKIIGRSPEEISRLNWSSITHPEDIQKELENMEKMNLGEIQGFKMTKRYFRPDQSIIWVNVAITPIENYDTEDAFHLCMIEDITEKREAEIIIRNREILLQQNVLLELNLLKSEMDFNEKIKYILSKTAQSLNCEHTSLWLVNDDGISTEHFYKLSKGDFIERNPYSKREYPVFFKELEKNQNIVVNDVNSHPATIEFVDHFKNLNVTSLLIIPLKKDNKLIGVFYFENIGNPKFWSKTDEVFIHSISEFIILAFESEELKQAKEKLKINEERWKFAVLGSNDGLWDWDVETSKVYRSSRWYEMLGFETKELDNTIQEWLERIHTDDIVDVNVELQKHFQNKSKSYVTEYRILCKDGSYKWILDRGKIISRNENGNPLRIVGTSTDITKRKRAEEDLLQSEGKLKAIFEGSNDAILLLTEKGFFDCNPKALEMFGIENKEELSHISPSDISPNVQPDGKKSSEKSNEMIRIAFEKGVNRFEWTYKHKNGEILSTEVLLSAFEYGGEVVLQSTVQDITNRKIAEEHIKKSLHEKEVLLKEVHHRVKNNLQIISSILNLQSSTITDQNTLDLLKNSQNRIRSMSLIHELLYQTKDFSTINFSEYIVSISTNLFQSYNQNKNTKLTLELDPLFLDLDIAISCGLIINELVTNSLKYAFDINQTNGEVKIQLSQKGDEVLLKIEDNGKGFPNDIDFRETESLGMQLVVSLIDQIDGEIILENTSGAKYELRFKNVSKVSERLN